MSRGGCARSRPCPYVDLDSALSEDQDFVVSIKVICSLMGTKQLVGKSLILRVSKLISTN